MVRKYAERAILGLLSCVCLAANLSVTWAGATSPGPLTAKDDDGVSREFLQKPEELPFEFVLMGGEPHRCAKVTMSADGTILGVDKSCSPEYAKSFCKLFYSLKDTTSDYDLGKLGTSKPEKGVKDKWRWILSGSKYDKAFTYALFCTIEKGARPIKPPAAGSGTTSKDPLKSTPTTSGRLNPTGAPGKTSETTNRLTIDAHWMPGEGGNYRIDGYSKEIAPIKYPGTANLFVVATRTGQDGRPLAGKFEGSLTITVQDRATSHLKEVYNKTVKFGVDVAGVAVIPFDQKLLLKSLDDRINHDVIEAQLRLVADGKTASCVSTNLLHVLEQKLILFVPGVAGSWIWVAKHPGTQAYPHISKEIRGEQEASWLQCGEDGRPTRDSAAVRLDLFRKYPLENVAGVLPFPGVAIYDVENRPEVTTPQDHPHLLCNGRTVPYFYVQPWPYDWRGRLEEVVDRLTGATGSADGSIDLPYADPPSIAQVMKSAKIRFPFLADKVAIAGHSTGGLIIRGLLQRKGVEALVDRAFFIDTPFWGAPKSYYVFLTGDMGIDFIANRILRDLSPSLPIVYYLAPSDRYPGTVASVRSTNYHRDAGHPAYTFMDNMVLFARRFGLYPKGKLMAWNRGLDMAAQKYHASIQGVPLIGWDNCTVFWSDSTLGNTRGDVYIQTTTHNSILGRLIEDGELGSHYVKGDGTVPIVSQQADFPADSLIEIPTHPEHVPSPSEPFVWQKIIEKLLSRELR